MQPSLARCPGGVLALTTLTSAQEELPLLSCHIASERQEQDWNPRHLLPSPAQFSSQQACKSGLVFQGVQLSFLSHLLASPPAVPLGWGGGLLFTGWKQGTR